MIPTLRFRINAPEVVHEIIDSEAVVINLARGNYYSLEGAAAEIWDWLDGGASAGEVAGRLADRYHGDRDAMDAALTSFVDELEAEGLIVPAPNPVAARRPFAPIVAVPVTARLPFEAPRITKFTDMQALLLLDPIHEVDPSGWPPWKS